MGKKQKLEKKCWLFLDCQVMTGYPPSQCPNYKNCKRNAKHSENRECFLPYDSFDEGDCQKLIVWITPSTEAQEVGWQRPCELPYLRTNEALIVGGFEARIICSIERQAQEGGWEVAEFIPYYWDSQLKAFAVRGYLLESHKKAGFGRAVDLPWNRKRGPKRWEVDFLIDDSDYKDAIAAGWHPAISL